MVDLTQKNDNETLNAFNFAAEIQKNVKPTVKPTDICSTNFLNRKTFGMVFGPQVTDDIFLGQRLDSRNKFSSQQALVKKPINQRNIKRKLKDKQAKKYQFIIYQY